MPVDPLGSIGQLPRLQPLAPNPATNAAQPAGAGFASVLNNILASNQQANEAANQAVTDLATGKAQDLHTVTLALAKADTSFRLMLEMRNRLSDAFQEISRMQV